MTQKFPRRLAVVAVAATASLALASCAGAGGNESSGGGETLTVSTSFVLKTLDPAMVYEATGVMAVHSIYDTLMTFDGSDVSSPQPHVAESVEASDDAKTFTFSLRDDIEFADGTPLNADDVAFSLNRLINMKSSASQIVAGLSVEATDDTTVTVTSEQPNPDVPTILSMPSTSILNSEAAAELGADDSTDAATVDTVGNQLNENSIGSGPYTVTSFDVASRIVLEANEDYWGDAPEFQRVVIENADVQNQKLSIGRASGAAIVLDLSGSLLEGLPAELQVSSVPDTAYYLSLNQDPAISEVTSNPAFNQALRATIDHEAIAALFGEDAVPAAGLVPGAFAGSLPQDEVPERDIDLAEEILADAGLAGASVTLTYPAITYRGVDLGTIVTQVQADAAEAGIAIELTPQPINVFLESQGAGKNEMGFTPSSLNYPVAASLVNNMAPGASTSLRNGWTLERADASVIAASEDVVQSVTQESRVQAMQEWQRLMKEYSPYIALAENSGVVVATSDLTGVDYAPAGWSVDLAAVGTK